MSKNGLGRKSGAGKLFLGIFLGFILCLGLIAGIGWFAYNNVSIQWINKTFKTDLDISEEMNKKTIKEIAESAVSAINNIDTYSLNDMKNDFGFSVGDSLMGIDISDLKDVPLKNLSAEAQNKLSNISADELKDVVDISDMDLILNKTNTYYVYGDKLYTDEAHTKEVNTDEIPYTLSSTTVEFKNQTRNIQDGKVEIELRYLPLTKSLGDFMGTLGEKITVGELVDSENGFGVELPSYLYDTQEKKDRTINELSDIVNGLYLAEFLGYEISDNVVTKDGEEVTGIVAKLAKKTIDELTDVETIIQESTIAEVLDYKKVNGVYYYNNGTEDVKVTGIMKALAEKQIQNLTNEVDSLKMVDVLDFTVEVKTVDGESKKIYKDSNGEEVTGFLTFVDLEETELKNISTAFQDAIKGKTLDQLAEAGVINSDSSAFDKVVKDEVIDDNSGESLQGKTLGELTIDQIILVLDNLLS